MNSDFLTKIVDFLPDATFAIDSDSRVIAWNKAMETMTGVKRADVLGHDGHTYAVPFYGKKRPLLIDLALKDGCVADGSYYYFKFRS